MRGESRERIKKVRGGDGKDRVGGWYGEKEDEGVRGEGMARGRKGRGVRENITKMRGDRREGGER